jgi:outer membrane murein-binding lipoprotein Lpp
MKLYEIDKAIEDLIANAVDPETGELILDNEALDALQMERDAKVENLALYVKDLTAMTKAIREEEKALAERRQAVEKKAARLQNYLVYALQGQKFSTAKVACTFRHSETVDCSPEFVEWAKKNDVSLLRQKEPEANKAEIKAKLKAGMTIPYTALVEKQSLTIK